MDPGELARGSPCALSAAQLVNDDGGRLKLGRVLCCVRMDVYDVVEVSSVSALT